MKSSSVKTTITLLAILATAAVWWFGRSDKPGKIRNVIIISMDTTRADALSCYTLGQSSTPNIDAVADQGVLFENVISPMPLTLPAHSTMMTAAIPPQHGVHENFEMVLGDSNITLAEILAEHDFSTHAIISAAVLDRKFGLAQGFETYDDHFKNPIKGTDVVERRGDETSEVAMQWLQEHAEEKFFLFLHYYDPHYLYDAPEPFASKFMPVPDEGKQLTDIDKMLGSYAGEVAYMDYCIGQVIEKLKALDLYDSSLIVLVGDHGEMLLAHQEQTHGYFIYQEAIKVPMIFKIPGVIEPKRINSIAGIVDIAPTICSLLEIKMPAEIQGVDLSGQIRSTDTAPEDRAIFCESLAGTKYNANSMLGVVTDRYKYIQTTRPELYDLAEDPGEKNDLIEIKKQHARVLQDRLRQILDAVVDNSNRSGNVEMDEKTLKALESLGYVGGGVDTDLSFDQNKDDPKDLINFHKDVAKVQDLTFNEKYDQAESLCKKLIDQRPGVPITQFKMAMLLVNMKEHKRAIPYLEETVRLKPDDYRAYKSLGDACKEVKKYEKAVQAYREIQNLKPDEDFIFFALAQTYDAMGKTDLMVKEYKETIRVNPEHIIARVSLTDAYLREKKIALALEQYYKLAELVPDSVTYHNAVGWLLATTPDKNLQNPTDAVKYALKACELTEYKNLGTLDTLAAAYACAGKFDKAIDVAKKAIELANSEKKHNKIPTFKKRLELYRSRRPYYE